MLHYHAVLITDRLLSELQQAAGRLDSALASITGRLPEETQQELEGMRGLLQRARFELAPQHAAIMAMFREGVWGGPGGQLCTGLPGK
jgi:hypothetical protein